MELSFFFLLLCCFGAGLGCLAGRRPVLVGLLALLVRAWCSHILGADSLYMCEKRRREEMLRCSENFENWSLNKY